MAITTEEPGAYFRTAAHAPIDLPRQLVHQIAVHLIGVKVATSTPAKGGKGRGLGKGGRNGSGHCRGPEASSFALLIGGAGSTTKAWRLLVKGMMAQDDRAYLAVPGVAAAAECLSAFPRSLALRIKHAVRAGEVACVVASRPVRSLDLSGSGTMRRCTRLGTLSGLHSLNLSHTQVSDVCALSAMTGLRTLLLEGCNRLSDVRSLSTLVGLHTLNICNTRLQNVRSLSSHVNLQTLSLAGTPVEDIQSLAFTTHSEHRRHTRFGRASAVTAH
jgi:hypothetical protein